MNLPNTEGTKSRLGGEARAFHFSIYTDIYESFILSRVAIESIFYKDEIGLKPDDLNLTGNRLRSICL